MASIMMDGSPGTNLSRMPDESLEPVERGRYAVFPKPDGGLAIARAGEICDRCADCGCGTQRDPIDVPALVVALAREAMAGNGTSPLKAVKAMKKR